MGGYTRYLVVQQENRDQFHVSVTAASPLETIRSAIDRTVDLRYSPIFPAYLVPDEGPASLPDSLSNIAFFFHPKPHFALGRLRPSLAGGERDRTFFTQGLASIVLLNCDESRARLLMRECECPQLELWTIAEGCLDLQACAYHESATAAPAIDPPAFTWTGMPEIDVYIEQIAASCAALWSAYTRYHPSELATLAVVARHLTALTQRYVELRKDANRSLITVKKENAILAALVELSAALSYSVTQGTSGSSPILRNRSPFPHLALLGIGGAVRAVTNFTRSLECAFKYRSAASVLANEYATKDALVPNKIAFYDSGAGYKFATNDNVREEFDYGGDFPSKDHFPLLCHFSLRHGFKEAKYSVTAASESLTTECMPAWTMMTLSHEIMHSRVRHIMYALFGTTWEADEYEKEWKAWCRGFARWYRPRNGVAEPILSGIRNAILSFCLARERHNPVETERSQSQKKVNKTELLNAFRTHKRLASELLVHFHDYFFIYARQPRLYTLSLWASWPTVAALAARPEEYLVRTLATLACGTGAEARAAFQGAADQLLDALDQLEAIGTSSPVYAVVRDMLSQRREELFAMFRPAYYLIDQVRRFFASTVIAKQIDRIDTDPFAAGSTIASEYTDSIYVQGENAPLSPVRHSLAALVRRLSGTPVLDDPQWLTGWNSMVICSQEPHNAENRLREPRLHG
jgi:hypothetical protein